MPVPTSPPPNLLIDLDELKDHLNKTTPGTVDDAELLRFIDAVIPVIEHLVGPVLPRTVTEVYDGGTTTLSLRSYPVLAVTRVREYSGPSYAELEAHALGASTDGYVLDAGAGLLSRGWGGPFLYGRRNVEVVYEVGRDPIEEDIRLAAKELVAHWWGWSQVGRAAGGALGALQGDGDELAPTTAGLGYAIPNRVKQMLAPFMRARVGIA